MATALVPRSPTEAHRAATPLELFLDLCFVVAVAQAAASLHHAIAEDHVRTALIGYPMLFFAIWWAWMGYTWFASAYDNDGVGIRLAVFVQIVGVLVIAAGIPRAFDEHDFGVIVLGYVIMRLALVSLWLWAAASDPIRRRTALRYAIGIVVVQLGWVGFIFVPMSAQLPVFLVLVVAELAVPAWGERAEPTTWHPHHIAERYGGFTIIVLGESILSIMLAVKVAVDGGATAAQIAPTVLGGVGIVCAMWWLYFSEPTGEFVSRARKRFEARNPRGAYLWGYGHFVVYMATAAVGAGIAAVVDAVSHESHTTMTTSTLSVGVPATVYVLCMMLLHRHSQQNAPGHQAAYLVCAAAVLALGALGLPIIWIGVLLALLVGYVALAGRGRLDPQSLRAGDGLP